MSDELRRRIHELAEIVNDRGPQPDVEQVLHGGRRLRFRLVVVRGLGVAATAAALWLLVSTIVPTPQRSAENTQPLQTRTAVVPERAIAFAAASAGGSDDLDLFVAKRDGSGESRLTDSTGSSFYPAWGPDGRRLAFVSSRAGGNVDIYVVDSVTNDVIRVTSNPSIDTAPAWSPDGMRIVFSRNLEGQDEIFTVDAEGNGETRLTENSNIDATPAWSPLGDKIAFARNVDGNVDVYIMDVDGANVVRLTSDPGSEHSPTWSPDGKRIAFLRADSSDLSGLYVMSADGTDVTQLTNDDMDKRYPEWAPDGEQILFSGGSPGGGGDWQLYSIQPDGTGRQAIPSGGKNALMPSVRP